jgi:outer membrane protein assembly factor BamD
LSRFSEYSGSLNFVRMKLKYLFIILLGINLAACSDYQKLLQNPDTNLKWERAQAYYEQKKYRKTIELIEPMIAVFKETDKIEKVYFTLAKAYYDKGDYYSSFTTFETLYKTYPKSEYAEESRFMAGKAVCVSSPDPRLSQEETLKGMDLLNVFVDYYPESKFREEAVTLLQKMQDKLVYKQLLTCKLYYNLGNYQGNNYTSCVVTATNALLDYPISAYREDLSFILLKAKYTLATKSADRMKIERYRAALDEYYTFTNEYPKSKYQKEAASMLKECRNIIKD